MKPFSGLGLAVDRPGRCCLSHPVTGAPLMVLREDAAPEQAYIDILSCDIAPAQEHRFSRQDQERLFRRELSPAEDYDSVGTQLARMTTGWLLCDLNGRPLDVPCSFDMARDLFNGLETRWLRTQVFGFALTPGNFPPAT